MKSPLFALLLATAVILPVAAESLPQAGNPPPLDAAKSKITASIKTLNPQADVKSIKDSPISGIKEVRADGQVLYFSPDGKYLIAGDVIEVATRKNLTESARALERVSLLKQSPQAEHIVFGKKDNPNKVYVFTDISCSYCQKLHSEVPKLVAAGITVEYLAWPRGGPRSPAYSQMESIWCSKDRNQAYDAGIAGKKVAPAKCANPIRQQFELGQALQVEGTPAVFDSNGVQLGGYVPADQIIAAIKD